MDPFDRVQADDRIALRYSFQVEQIFIDDGYITWEFLADCQTLWQYFQVFFWLDDMSVVDLFCRLLEIGRKLQDRQLNLFISADCTVLLTVLHYSIDPLLAQAQQISIDVQGHYLFGHHPDGYLHRHRAIPCAYIQNSLVEEELVAEMEKSGIIE